MKTLFLLMVATATFVMGCTQSKNNSESNPVADSIESYQKFLEQFEQEVNKSNAKNADTDEWESAAQSLFINSQNYNNEIQRHWKQNKTVETSELLEQWADAELFSYKIERLILQHWQNKEISELKESLVDISDASKVIGKTDAEIQALKTKIESQINESEQIFSGAINDISIRETELKANYKILIKP
ncbi:MAG: hypothetical protein KF882_08660 [Bacteroidia bacterium]|jgi:acyl transferase domain-containing protein|nr:hypothetical protein [Bacteroidia bacterium]